MLKAIELGGESAGGFAGMFLATLGGKVTRVIPSGGSDGATLAPGSRAFYRRAYLDRNKEALPLDIASSEGLEQLRDILGDADLLIDTLAPGKLRELGIALEDVHRYNPSLTIVSITPFGQDGPRAGWVASELVVQAMGGLLASSGDADKAPARLAGEQAAHLAGVLAAVLGLAAVRGTRSGVTPGVHIDISMQEVLSTAWAREIGRYTHTGEGLTRTDRGGLQGFPHTARCADGYVFLHAREATWEELALFLGLYDFVSEEWSDASTRVQRWDELKPHFNEALLSKGRYEWFTAAAKAGYTFAPIEDAYSVLDSPQLRARQYFHFAEIEGETVAIPSLPFTFATLDNPASPSSDGS